MGRGQGHEGRLDHGGRGHDRPIRVFGTEAVPVGDGLPIVGVGVTLFALIETEKQIRLRLRAMRQPAIVQ
jgi:hypothetical protein